MSEHDKLPRLWSRISGRIPNWDVQMALGDQLLVSGMTFLIGIGVARMLGIAEFGRLAMVLILQMFAQSLQGCFVVAPMMALSGRRERRSASYFASVVAWSGALSILAGLAVGCAVGVIYGLRDGTFPLALAVSAGLYTATQNMIYTTRRMLFAQHVGSHAFIMDLVRYVLFLSLVAAIWWSLGSLNVTSTLAALGVSGLVALGPLWMRLRGARLRPLMLQTVWGRHWPYAQWLALMMVLTFGQEQAIALGLGAVLSDEALGGLRAGQYLIGVTHFIWVTLENFVPTGASRAHASGGVPALQSYLKETTLTLGLVVWGFILLVSIPAEFSLRLAFGPGYEQFASILRIYALTYAIAFFREVWVFFFYATERTDVIFRAFGAGFIVAAIAFYPAIKMFGVPGAALTVFLANTASTIFIMLSAWKFASHTRRVSEVAIGSDQTPRLAK